MSTPYRTENSELSAAAEAIGLRVLGVYHHPAEDRDTVFAKCPSCGAQSHYPEPIVATRCGCDILAHSILKEPANAIDKRSKEYLAWSRACYRIRKDIGMVAHPIMGSFRQFIAELGPSPSKHHALSVQMVPNDVGPDDLPLTVGPTADCDLAITWRSPRPGNAGWRLPNRYYTDDTGERHTAIDWQKITGVSAHTIRCRVAVNGWSDNDAVHRPVRHLRRRTAITDEESGETLSVPEWSRLSGVPKTTIGDRLARGETIREALT